MTKDELRNIRQYKKLLDAIEQDLKQQENEIVNIRSQDYSRERIQGGIKVSQEELICKLIDQQKELMHKKTDLINKQEEVKRQIFSLDRYEHQAVLYRYYILGDKWADIAESLCVTERTIQRWHGKALNLIKDVI